MSTSTLTADRRFGYAWVGFAAALALHVTDEATHDFLSVYNPTILAMRARFPLLPLPTFTFPVWLGGLIGGIALLFLLSPYAFRGARWLRLTALPIGLVVGVFNASLHFASSLYYHRLLPGVLSAPVLLPAAVFLLLTARNTANHEPATASHVPIS